jgi:hypothetical protein
MTDIKQYKFVGMVLPNGIPSTSSNEVIFSVCLNINKYCENFSTDGSPAEIQERYDNFYIGLQQIKNYLNKLNEFDFEIKIPSSPTPITRKGKGSTNPFEFFCNESDFIKDIDDLNEIKEDLWGHIFPTLNKSKNSIKVNNVSKLSFHEISEIHSLLHDDDLLHVNSFALDNEINKKNILDQKANDEKIDEPKIKQLLNSIQDYGQISERIAYQEKVNFLTQNIDKNSFAQKLKTTIETLFTEDFREKSISKEEKKKSLSFLWEIQNEATKNYLESTKMDIDEVVNNFTAITNEPALMRLMGLTKDFKIDLKDLDVDTFSISPLGLDSDIFSLPTEIIVVKNKNKSKKAYLVKSNNEKYFNKSVLKGASSSLRSFDLVSKTTQLIDYSEKILKGEHVKYNENKDALTRGILYTNEDLPKMITPVSLVDENGNISVSSFTDEFVTRGHRVAVRVNENSRKQIYSLTGRSLSLKLRGDKKPFYYCGNAESCVHFDTPLAYMEDGQVKAVSSDVLFEYSGELLKLKSAFSKANKISKADKESDKAEFHHDGGLHKSIARFEQKDGETNIPLKGTVVFSYFPFNEIQKEAWLNCAYSIPSLFSKNFSPKLRYGNKYTFAVYQEYLNGWGLPLHKQENSAQLSLDEIIDEDSTDIFPNELEFTPLENKKAVVLYHRKSVSDDLSKPITEKPSLDSLVVRSDSGEDPKQFIDERHVLPSKISNETAFWYGLLSQLGNEKSFEYKKRANCPFADKDAYNKYIDETDEKGMSKGNKCVECGKSYCGGTQMEKYYSAKHITPNHFFTDPSIKGFTLKFFWDEECSEDREIQLNEIGSVKFGGIPGLNPRSYLLRAKGASGEAFVENHHLSDVLEIYLKKGMSIYAQLTNYFGENDKGELVKTKLIEGGWWNQMPLPKFKNDFLLLDDTQKKKIFDETNRPKLISLTHAVKEPLITPKIIKLKSTPNDHKFIEHINDWLKEEEYKRYKVGINIVANRIDRNNPNESLINSSHTQIELSSHFERLDAIRKIEFLKDILPTGALELWMRKEDFIDNPEQIVLSSKSATNHVPNEPILSFSDRKNIFTLDYKIEFSNETISQLKNLKNIEDIDSITDVFRSLITKLNLQYDFKTTKFEEREYYLKDISKFKGFFTDEKFNDNGNIKALDKLEEFALPKIKDVMSDLGEDSKFRFKVIVLNNSQPPKPDVAFAVTTIQETRSNPSSQKTISIQKGNIVTIYLKRGRLKSGKDERVGVIVDAESLYNKLFKDNELISKAGRDIVSDRYSNRSQYLQYGDIIIPEINEYKAGFDNELGIYHYLPKFDVEKQLWKIEVELDIKSVDGKQLHNPFINFSIVHFQPFSINYNDKTADASLLELKNDCRISDIENSSWCYLLPERKLSVFFDKPGLFDTYGEVDLTVSFDHESLHHFNSAENIWKVRSNFIVTVQGSDDELEWQPVGSWLDDGIKTENDFGFHHPLLSKSLLYNEENLVKQKLKFNKWVIPNNRQNSNKYSYFRVRFIEVEWFTNETWDEVLLRNKELLSVDVVDNEEMRIRFVELIY